MRPFFSFFGSKWHVANYYPAPTHSIIIEPFAGSAGYSLRYPEHQVRLYDADPIICGLRNYLIRVTAEEIRPPSMGGSHELNRLFPGRKISTIFLPLGCELPSSVATHLTGPRGVITAPAFINK
jgi:hypothetical protein